MKLTIRLPWKHPPVNGRLAEAKAEHALSAQNYEETESLLKSLREIRRRNHIGELITNIIQQKVEEEVHRNG